MKKFLKKYIGIIIGILVSISFLLGYHYNPTNPKLAHIFIEIVAWFISLMISLAIIFIFLKIFLWGIRKINKQKPNKNQTMKPNCDKCEWHHLRAGYSYNWRTGITTHNVMIDVCIHPILDDLQETDSKGQKAYHIEKCEIRNINQTCKYFQPKSSLIRKIIDTFRGKKMIDIYDRYNKLKTHTAYEFYKKS